MTSPAASSTDQAVYATVSYADVFDMPVELDDVHRFLVGRTRTLLETSMAVDNLVSQQLLGRTGDLVYLTGRDEVLDVHRERTVRAAAMWKVAAKWGRHIGRIPFVRMVAVTGGLAVDSMAKNDTVDFCVAVRPRRLWLTRRMIVLVARLAARRGIELRPKLVVSTRALEMTERSLYPARELAQMAVIVGQEVCRTVRRSNTWIFEFLPNATLEGDESHLSDVMPSRAQKWAEWFLLLPPFRLVESWERRRSIAELSRSDRSLRAGGPDASWYTAEVCKGEFLEHAAAIDAAWTQRSHPG